MSQISLLLSDLAAQLEAIRSLVDANDALQMNILNDLLANDPGMDIAVLTVWILMDASFYWCSRPSPYGASSHPTNCARPLPLSICHGVCNVI